MEPIYPDPQRHPEPRPPVERIPNVFHLFRQAVAPLNQRTSQQQKEQQ